MGTGETGTSSDTATFQWTLRDPDLCTNNACKMNATLAGRLAVLGEHERSLEKKVLETIEAEHEHEHAHAHAHAAMRSDFFAAEDLSLACALKFFVHADLLDALSECGWGRQGSKEGERVFDVEMTSWCPASVAQRFTVG